ncbi:Uncharacterised protein [Enterobacter hormaechei]|nr:Uncharacterised protein [Enterobacter hormaechei]
MSALSNSDYLLQLIRYYGSTTIKSLYSVRSSLFALTSICRDNAPLGRMIRKSPSDQLIIWQGKSVVLHCALTSCANAHGMAILLIPFESLFQSFD